MRGRILSLLLFVALSPSLLCEGCSWGGHSKLTARHWCSFEIALPPSAGREVLVTFFDKEGIECGGRHVGVVDTAQLLCVDTLWRFGTDSLGQPDSLLVTMSSLPTGIYLYTVKAGDSTMVAKKAVLLK